MQHPLHYCMQSCARPVVWQKLLFSWKTLGVSACIIWIHDGLLQNIIIYVVTDIVHNLIIPPTIILDECKALWGQTWASTECMCASVHACVCVCQSGQIEDGWRLHMLMMYQESIWWEVIQMNMVAFVVRNLPNTLLNSWSIVCTHTEEELKSACVPTRGHSISLRSAAATCVGSRAGAGCTICTCRPFDTSLVCPLRLPSNRNWPLSSSTVVRGQACAGYELCIRRLVASIGKVSASLDIYSHPQQCH